MTREELIKHLEHLAEYVKYSEDAPALREVIEMLKCSENPNSSDTIYRQAAIDALYHVDEYNGRSIKTIRNLPPAKPERCEDCVNFSKTRLLIPQPEERTQERTQTHACDCVSRQAAIDALSTPHGILYPIRTVEELPSAQPDLSEYSDKLWRSAYERGKRDAQPEIIRCKDCRHDDHCAIQDTARTGNTFFCGAAERREE